MLFLTFNDPPSGIYYSQVTDVCRFINKAKDIRVRLLAFVSMRDYFTTRRKIRAHYADSIVLPMFPGVRNWKRNAMFLRAAFFFVRPTTVIARGPFASWLALRMKEKRKSISVCFDARGAYTAEFNEYNVSGEGSLNKEIRALEKDVLYRADNCIAVSEKLVGYWKREFGYTMNKHVVIPCTMGSEYEQEPDFSSATAVRKQLGVSEDEVLLVYSGSGAGWQSSDLLFEFVAKIMALNSNARLLLLAREFEDSRNRLGDMKSRVMVKWVEPDKVRDLLLACDFGLLIRERSVTNEVASPVKFAEYISAGLKVIISEGIGDYPAFVTTHHAGHVVSDNGSFLLSRPSLEEKKRISALAPGYFSKASYIGSYNIILRK